MMLPGRDGRYHHGTEGSIAPGTLVLADGREIVALADVVPLYVSNLYAHDAEYVLAIRVREIVAAARWARLPWAAFRPPTVIYAVDKFHDTAWSREPGVDATISYGGGWDDLQQLADEEAPPACSDPPWIDPALPPSDGAMIRAVMRGDAARLRKLIARGGNLGAGVDAPSVRNGLTLGASWPAHHNLLVLAIDNAASTEVLEILLDAGLPADFAAGPSSWTALHAAVSRGLAGHVDVLLRRGADPARTINGLDAIEPPASARRCWSTGSPPTSPRGDRESRGHQFAHCSCLHAAAPPFGSSWPVVASYPEAPGTARSAGGLSSGETVAWRPRRRRSP